MDIDDAKAMAALLVTARHVLRARVQPQLEGDAKLDVAMVANAMGLIARTLDDPGAAWSRETATRRDMAALREHVRRRLEVANPDYVDQVRDAPV